MAINECSQLHWLHLGNQTLLEIAFLDVGLLSPHCKRTSRDYTHFIKPIKKTAGIMAAMSQTQDGM